MLPFFWQHLRHKKFLYIFFFHPCNLHDDTSIFKMQIQNATLNLYLKGFFLIGCILGCKKKVSLFMALNLSLGGGLNTQKS